MPGHRGTYPDMSGIVAELGLSESNQQKFKPYAAEMNRWVDLREIENAIVRGATIPAQRTGADKKVDKDVYLIGLSFGIHWLSLRNGLNPPAQIDFMSKQNRLLQDPWAKCFDLVHVPQILGVWLECLRRDFDTSAMEGAFRSNLSSWCELSELVPLAEFPTWAMKSREAVYNLLSFSKSQAFRDNVIKLLYNDPDRYLRRIVRDAVDRGDVPINCGLLEDRYQRPNLEESKELWSKFLNARVPDALALDPMNLQCNIHAPIRFMGEQMAKVAKGEKANGGTVDLSQSCVNFWMEHLNNDNREYLLLLKRVVEDVNRYT